MSLAVIDACARRVVVLLHGFTQTRQSWRRTVAALGGRYRALTPDLPGHGQAAERRPASFAACAAYVRALADGPCTLVGYSMGGRIALYTALALPGLVERLVLVGASPGIADAAEREARRRADAALADRIEAIGVEAFARGVGRPAAVRRSGGARRGRRPRRPAAQHRAPAWRPRCAGWGPA